MIIKCDFCNTLWRLTAQEKTLIIMIKKYLHEYINIRQKCIYIYIFILTHRREIIQEDREITSFVIVIRKYGNLRVKSVKISAASFISTSRYLKRRSIDKIAVHYLYLYFVLESLSLSLIPFIHS